MLVLGVAATPATQTTATAAEGEQPNIVLISTDDMNVQHLRHMPFTRRLIGGQGVTFEDAVAPNPLCCPARATMLTGQHSHNNKVATNSWPNGGQKALEPLNDRLLPVWLQAAGYDTTFVGKYLNGYGRDDGIPPGWKTWYASVVGGGLYDYYGATYNQNGDIVDRSGEYQADITQQVTEEAIAAGAETDKPFFVWQSNLAPHGACWPNPDGSCSWAGPMWDRAENGQFTDLLLPTLTSPAFNERVVSEKPVGIRALPSMSGPRTRRLVTFHRAQVRSLQAVDRNVRDIVGQLEETGELANTLIIFTSDNGFLLGEHRASGKVLPYEPSLKVPLLMRGPGLPAGARTAETAALVDIAPTIAAAAEATPTLTVDGRSLLPVAKGERRGYGALAIEAGLRGGDRGDWFYQGVRTGRYTYVAYPQTGERELYDRRVDPHQLNNVAYRPTYRQTRSALAEKLAELRRCVGDECLSVAASAPGPVSDGTPVHPDELGSTGRARQVVTLTASSWSTSRGTAVAWQRQGRTWRVVRGPFSVRLGRHGLTMPDRVRHLRGKTPVGTFRPATVMGLSRDPGTQQRYRRLDRDDHWPFDPRDPSTYNVFQPDRGAKATWNPALDERWSAHRSRYSYAMVMRYNLPSRVVRSARYGQQTATKPADVRKGSFVVHVGDPMGKQGWVSMPRARMRWLLTWMRPSTLDTKFVVGTPGYLRKNL